MKFAVDKMLGRLAKWLRILGYDTLFDPYVSSDVIQRQAAKEKRIFLTREARRANYARIQEVYVVAAERYSEQLREIADRFQLDIESYLFTRCTICNDKIVPVQRDEVKDRVPEQSALTFSDFYQCPKCKRVYWEGTHTTNTKRRLREIFPELPER